MNDEWKPIDTAPEDTDLLVWTRFGCKIAHFVSDVGWIGDDWEEIWPEPEYWMWLPDEPKP
jgi:hypothetical protein